MLRLRYYQQLAVDSFFEYTSNNWNKHPLIVLPTAAGKSLVIAYIVRHMLEYPNTRILLLTHQAELIKQNFIELTDNFNGEIFLDVGIYSAGLDCRDTQNRILFAGIQSVYNKAWELGWFDLILVDECHLIPPKGEGMYRTFLAEALKINKNIVIGGLTATHFRAKEGLLTEGDGHLFDAVCYEAGIRELIDPHHYKNKDGQQYLCNLVSKSAVNKVDLSNVHVRGGEYMLDEMQQAFQANDLVSRAVKELIECTQDRKKILVFTAGIAHGQDVLDKILTMGGSAAIVHSKQKNDLNQQNIQNFKDSKIKYLINISQLTTGFNEKAIDCIAVLRSMMSPVLWIQICGRGLRMHPDKEDCLILDFGTNALRLGPIDKITIKKSKNGKPSEVSTTPQKECPQCQAILSIPTRTCPTCGYEFPSNPSHDDEASTAAILSEWQKPKPYDVEDVSYSRHQKAGKPDSLKVDYNCGIGIYGSDFSEWVCILHDGYAKKKATKWLRSRTNMQIETIEDALKNQIYFKQTKQIIVDTNGKFPTIVGYVLENDTDYKNRIDGITKEEQARMDEQLSNLLS